MTGFITQQATVSLAAARSNGDTVANNALTGRSAQIIMWRPPWKIRREEAPKTKIGGNNRIFGRSNGLVNDRGARLKTRNTILR